MYATRVLVRGGQRARGFRRATCWPEPRSTRPISTTRTRWSARSTRSRRCAGLLARLPGAAGIGVDVGSRFTLTHFGLFGFAVMSCGTLRELFSIAMRYFALTMMHIDLALFETAGDCVIELDAGHLPADVQGFFIERDIAGIITTTVSFALPVAEKYAEEVSAELAIDEELLRPLLELVPVHDVAFGRAHNRLHFPRAMFDEPLPQADRHTLQMCMAQCHVSVQTQRATPALHRAGTHQAVSRFWCVPSACRRRRRARPAPAHVATPARRGRARRSAPC